MPIFSKESFAGNYKYNRLVKEEAKVIKEQFANKNYDFAMNLMLGNNKFKVNGIEYEFKALKFSAGKSSSGLHTLANNLVNDLYELNRVVPLDFDDITKVPFKATGFTYSDDLNYHKLQGEPLTQEEIDEQMKIAYPATKEGAKEIEIQNLKDKKSENKLEAENKIKQRNNVSLDEVKDLKDLKEKLGISSPSLLNENEAYKDYLSARDKYDKEERELIEKYQKERAEIIDKQVADKNAELESWKKDNEEVFDNAVKSGTWKEANRRFIPVEEDDQEYYSRKYYQLSSKLYKDKDFLDFREEKLKSIESSQKYGMRLEIYNLKEKHNQETQKGIDEIKAQIQQKKMSDPKYVKGLAEAEKIGIDKKYVSMAVKIIKNAQDNYKAMSGVGRFFSYLNPFQNKYRTARNEISANVKELTETTSVNKKELSNYVYGKSEQFPTCNDKEFCEISEEYVTTLNSKLDKEIEFVQTGKKEVSEAEFEKKLEKDTRSKSKENNIVEKDKDSKFLENSKELENAL